MHIGPTNNDEMCNFYLMYWVAGQKPMAIEQGRNHVIQSSQNNLKYERIGILLMIRLAKSGFKSDPKSTRLDLMIPSTEHLLHGRAAPFLLAYQHAA